MDIKTSVNNFCRTKWAQNLINWNESTSKAQYLIAVMIILAFAGMNILSVRRNFSLTTDEDKHILYGEKIISGDSTRFDDSKMPVTGLNAIPHVISSYLDDSKFKTILSRLYVARIVTIVFSSILAFFVYYWSRSLYGFIPGLFSLSLYVLDPNIIAHSQLVTTDLYVTCAIFLAYLSLWMFANNRSLRTGIICLLLLGFSQITKYSAIVLFPLFLITILVYDAPEWIIALRRKGNLFFLLRKYLKYSLYAIVVSLLIINLGFLFNRSFISIGEYTFISDTFKKIQASLPALRDIPVPVPYPYLQGLDWMRNTEQTGSLSGNIYLLGQVNVLKGFPGYYFVASFLKVPIATQIILILSLFSFFTRQDCRATLRKNEIFQLIPVLFFIIYFNFFFKTQIGIRYFLPVFPLLYVFAGNFFVNWRDFPFGKKTLIYLLIAYLFVSVFSYYPYNLSYFNEFIWDRKQAYKYLADSNIDWGQGRNELNQYLIENTDAVYKPGKVGSGHLIVRVNDLVGVTADPGRYAWLRDNFEPVNTIAYSYLVYEISSEDIDKLCSTTTYCNR